MQVVLEYVKGLVSISEGFCVHTGTAIELFQGKGYYQTVPVLVITKKNPKE